MKYIHKRFKNMRPNLLEEEYQRCLRNIIQASENITNMTIDEDLDRVDLYRAFLHTMIDKAIQLKKLINYESNNR